MDKTIQFLKELTDLNAVPGNEKEVRDYMREKMQDNTDEITYDNLGSIIGVKKGLEGGPRIMISGHMDEIGFMVTRIDKDGFIKFQTLGGWWAQVMLAQQVTITTREGKKIHGVIGSKPPHALTQEERNKVTDIKSMFIDCGVASKEEAEGLGIKPGDMITPYIEFKELGNSDYLLAKAWDNRIGCAIAIDILNNLKGQSHPNEYYAVGSVQEEVGIRGAKTAAHKINPDLGIAIDVGLALDTPGNADKEGLEMGKGLQIHLLDARTIGHKEFREWLQDLAEEIGVPYQICAMTGGGTDAGMMHISHDGAPSLSIGIPSRYIHSHTSMIHKQDYLGAVKLLTEMIKRMDRNLVNKITFGE